MYHVPLELKDVIYNAATQSFEALVTVHDGSNKRRYACSINAPIDMEFDDAARGLATQALRRHARGQMDSMQLPAHTAPRARRAADLHRIETRRDAYQRPHAA